jgi:hypothetical protein
MGLIDSIIGVESGGNPNATNPNSSASGLGQFIDSTWLATIRQARPDLAQGKSDAELLALKTDPQLSREMTQAYADQNQAFLTKNGLPVTPGTTYLAHFAGPEGAMKILQADPNAPAISILGRKVAEANPFLAQMTARDLQAWADRKMGNKAAPVATAPASPASPPSAPLSLPQQAPVFPSAPPQAGTQSAPDQGGLQMPAGIDAPPIFFAQRRPIDLSKLRTAFKAPVFPRG